MTLTSRPILRTKIKEVVYNALLCIYQRISPQSIISRLHGISVFSTSSTNFPPKKLIINTWSGRSITYMGSNYVIEIIIILSIVQGRLQDVLIRWEVCGQPTFSAYLINQHLSIDGSIHKNCSVQGCQHLNCQGCSKMTYDFFCK